MKVALAGDTMLGRGVAERLAVAPPRSLFAPELVAAVGEADVCILNLECCIAERGTPARGKTFHFRGPDVVSARAPVVLEAGGFRLGVLALTDHPRDYAAGATRPGIAYADLAGGGVPDWVVDAIAALRADAILVTPHWGWNMMAEPVGHVRAASGALLAGGATLLAGHSAHLFHGVAPCVLYDLGDFLDDYRVDPELRNDLGLLFLVDLASGSLEAIPLKLEFAHTRFAEREDAAWIRRRFTEASAAFGTAVTQQDGRLVCAWR